MNATVPPPTKLSAHLKAEVAYLLLGNLRVLLEEPPEMVTSRWLIAVLDRLLAHRIPIAAVLELQHVRLELLSDSLARDTTFYMKLQRLRDRVAHQKPYALLANEVRCDLSELFQPPKQPSLARAVGSETPEAISGS